MSLESLVRALTEERRLADWSARGVYARAAWLARGTEIASGARTAIELSARVHRDTPAGRGSATFMLGVTDSADDALDAALMRASAAVGPAWRSPPPAAPARVSLADPALDPAQLAQVPIAIADQVAAAARAAGAELLDIVVEVEVEAIAIVTRQGLDARWPATRYVVDARLRRDGAVARVRRTARRRDELGLGVAVADAVDAALRRARALATPAGRIPVVVRSAALLHGGRGLFEALVTQANPAFERQGLVRYRPGQRIAAAATGAEPLTVTSDGTLPFGLRSAPLDERGAAVRRFELVSRGVARSLALDGREAALRGESPNGGVRGLVVEAGTEGEAALLASGPLLVVEAWDWLELAPVTGHFRASIALGHLVDRGARHDVTGGVVRGDALTALALAHRSREMVTTPEYQGPATWHLGEMTVD